MKTRTLSILLSFALLLAASCGTGGGSEEQTPKPSPAIDVQVEEEEEEEEEEVVARTGYVVSPDSEMQKLVTSLKNARRGNPVMRAVTKNMEVGVPALLKALKHPETNVRSQSSMILILVHRDQNKKLPQEVVDGLITSLAKEKDGEVRAIVAKAIRGSKDERFHGPLVAALKNDPYPAVKRNAAKAIGLRRVRAGIDPLIAGLSHENTRVRMECATALRKLKAKRAITPLIGLLTDSNSMVRDRAHKALKTITGKRLPADPSAWSRHVR